MSRDLSLYRPNVGVVLFDRTGRVWLGHRANTPGQWRWQFPQGGVDEGEDLETAARRELAEETGVTSVQLLDRTPDWIAYDFPPDLGGPRAKWGHKGQKQIWFAYRFTGDDAEIDLNAHGEPEFDAWRWAALAETPALIVPFKRKVYERVLDAFSRYAT